MVDRKKTNNGLIVLVSLCINQYRVMILEKVTN